MVKGSRHIKGQSCTGPRGPRAAVPHSDSGDSESDCRIGNIVNEINQHTVFICFAEKLFMLSIQGNKGNI